MSCIINRLHVWSYGMRWSNSLCGAVLSYKTAVHSSASHPDPRDRQIRRTVFDRTAYAKSVKSSREHRYASQDTTLRGQLCSARSTRDGHAGCLVPHVARKHTCTVPRPMPDAASCQVNQDGDVTRRAPARLPSDMRNANVHCSPDLLAEQLQVGPWNSHELSEDYLDGTSAQLCPEESRA